MVGPDSRAAALRAHLPRNHGRCRNARLRLPQDPRAMLPALSSKASKAANGSRGIPSSAPTRLLDITMNHGEVVLADSTGERRAPYRDPLEVSNRSWPPITSATVPGLPLPRFLGGAVGYLSYESVRAFEPRVGRRRRRTRIAGRSLHVGRLTARLRPCRAHDQSGQPSASRREPPSLEEAYAEGGNAVDDTGRQAARAAAGNAAGR